MDTQEPVDLALPREENDVAKDDGRDTQPRLYARIAGDLEGPLIAILPSEPHTGGGQVFGEASPWTTICVVFSFSPLMFLQTFQVNNIFNQVCKF